MRTFTIGSRSSELAVIQADYILSCLNDLPISTENDKPSQSFRLVTTSSVGDQIQNKALAAITPKDIENATNEVLPTDDKVNTTENKISDNNNSAVDKNVSDSVPNSTPSKESSSSTGNSTSSAPTSSGLFTSTLEKGLLSKRYDIAVHSLKDMPTTLPNGLCLAGITEREIPLDLVLYNTKRLPENWSTSQSSLLSTLAKGSVIGTSSLRRAALLKSLYPHLQVDVIRGNLNTRLAKLKGTWKYDSNVKKGESVPKANKTSHPSYAAIILAVAGVVRMGWLKESTVKDIMKAQHYQSMRLPLVTRQDPQETADVMAEILDPKIFPYSVSQGALGLECRATDQASIELCKTLSNKSTYLRCKAERALLRSLEGGCQIALAIRSAHNRNVLPSSDNSNPPPEKKSKTSKENETSHTYSDTLSLYAKLLSEDGKRSIEAEVNISLENSSSSTIRDEDVALAVKLGESVGDALKARGAKTFIHGLGVEDLKRPLTYGQQ
eukprot:g3337.t1